MGLSCKRKQGENFIRSLRNTLDKILLQDFQPKFVYTGTKLSAKFQIKDITKYEQKHLIYYGECPKCDESYVGKTGRRHSYHKSEKNVSRNNFQILGNGYKKVKCK